MPEPDENERVRPEGFTTGGYRPMNGGYSPVDKRGYSPVDSGEPDLPKAPVGGTGQTALPTSQSPGTPPAKP